MTLHPNMGLTAAAGLRSRDSHYGWVAKVAEEQPGWLASLPARLRPLVERTIATVGGEEVETSGHMGHGAQGRGADMRLAPPKL